MKNLIVKVLILFVVSLLTSCSKKEEIQIIPTPNTQFFNLKIGNKWVYKKYDNSGINPTQMAFTGEIDTVKIVSLETYQGLTFAKKSSHKINVLYNYDEPVTYSYVRVNNLGHLIEIMNIYNSGIPTLTETDGLVLHPGLDQNYVYNQTFDYGSMEHHLYNSTNINVEGNNYLVYPYKGNFTPNPAYSGLVSKTIEFNYKQNVGLVKQVCHSVYGNYTWEKRLTSYELN